MEGCMVARKSKTPRPAPARPKKPSKQAARPKKPSARTTAPTAAELPVTRAMLTDVRTELLERIDQAKHELGAEIAGVKAELGAEIAGVKAELRAGLHDMQAQIDGLRAEMRRGFHTLQAEIHGIKAEVARIALLVEEQNARNKIVLDALAAFIDRQDRLEQRMDNVEETVRGLASTHPAS
jgi:uncharacterized protein (UPF0335 family)